MYRSFALVKKVCTFSPNELLFHLSSTVKQGQNLPLINYETRRYGRRYRKWHHWPNDFLPFQWERPKQDPPYLRTGDSVRDIGAWDPKALIVGAEHSKALDAAPEVVRRLFSLEFAERADIVLYQQRKIVNQIQRNPFDTLSPEVRIAEYTVKIRNNLYHFCKVNQYDALRKIRQNILVNRRNVFLKELYYQDRDRFQYVTRLLGISYTPPKLGVKYLKPTRKGELRRLTTEYCDQIKDERLSLYHQQLKLKQNTLDQEMKKIERLIEQEDKYLGVQNNQAIHVK